MSSSSGTSFGSPVEADAAYRGRYTHHRERLQILSDRAERIREGGGPDRIERHHDRGKLTARERIDRLVDEGGTFRELGLFAGEGMYEEEGGCPAGGTVAGVGPVAGTPTVIVANDATVKAGAWFPITVKKSLRAQEIALENRIPIVYLVDSAGVYLPMQDEIFPDRDDFGRIFYHNARLSSEGVTQIAGIMGSCVAGGAYLPVMSDEVVMVEGTGSVFLAGPFLVRAAIGEDVDEETLGGARTHSEISGVADYRVPDDEACLETIRDLLDRRSGSDRAEFDRATPSEPAYEADEIYGILPEDGTQRYDMRQILARIVDAESWRPYKRDYGQSLLCGYARLDGWSVGIVANQREVVRDGKGEMQIGGVIYGDAADKAARFIMNCNQKRIPVVFFQDVTGFMVGKRAEHGGIIKDGAKMVNVVANSTVPLFTVVVGSSYGAGNYAMGGRAYGPRLMLAWPSAQMAVMGGQQAARTMAQLEVRKLERKGEEVSQETRETIEAKIRDRYEEQVDPVYAAARLWVDAIVDPTETRAWLSAGIEMADRNPDHTPFNPGILQT